MADVTAPNIDWYGPMVQNQPLFNPTVKANIANTQAGTALLGQQTQGKAIENQTNALTLGLYQKALGQTPGALSDQQQAANDKSGVSNPDAGDGAPPSSTPGDPLGDQALRAMNFVNPAGTPQMQQALQQAALVKDKLPGLYDQAQLKFNQTLQSQSAQNTVMSNNMYDALSHVANTPDSSPPGAAMAALSTVAPGAAKFLQSQLPSDATPQQLDSAARDYAAGRAAAVHQYTGRKVDIDDAGVPRDEVTQEPVPGVPSRGLSSSQWADLATKLNAPVNDYALPNGQKGTVPTFITIGYKTLQQALAAQGAKLGVQGVQPGAPGVVQAQTNAAIKEAAGNATAINSSLSTPKSSDPTTNTALQDKEYRAQLPTSPPGISLSPDQQTTRDNYSKNSQQLQQDAAAQITNGRRALTLYSMANDLLQNGSAATGRVQSAWNQIQQWVPGLSQGKIPTDTAELAKLLGNAAIQVSKGNFADNLTNDKTNLQLHELSPSTGAPGPAIDTMIHQNVATIGYEMAAAHRVTQYLHAGNEPLQFPDWNQQYWPAEKIIPAEVEKGKSWKAPTPPGAAPAPAPAAAPPAAKQLPTGATLAHYAQTHFKGDANAATAYLKTQGYQ